MTKNEEIKHFTRLLRVTDTKGVAEIAAARGFYKEGASAVTNVNKVFQEMILTGELERCDGFYRIKGSEDTFKEHSRLLTKSLIDIIKLPYQHIVKREFSITEKGLRPDAIGVIRNEDRAICYVLEVCNSEEKPYLLQKVNTWRMWREAKECLGKIFGLTIPEFHIVVSGEAIGGTHGFNQFLEAIK